MFRNKLLLWGSRWLERRGLTHVAASLEAHVALTGDVAALHAVARRALTKRDTEGALNAINQALAISPDDATLWCTRGAIYRHAFEFDSAREAYERALEIDPRYVRAQSNMGEWCLAQGRAEEALTWLGSALEHAPRLLEAHINKAAALFELGRFDEALIEAEGLVERAPKRAEAHLNLANVLIHTGKAKQAIKHYKKALELRPGYEEAHYNLAALLGSRDDLPKAIGYLERQIKERGESAQRQSLLAAAYQADGKLSMAEKLCRSILERQPHNTSALTTLASCLSNAGDAAAALPLYQQVVEIDESQSVMGSNVLFELNYIAHLSPATVFKRHRDWAKRYAAPLIEPHTYDERNRDPERKLRIGYVSGDFCRHPVGFLFRDILHHHTGERHEIHCFSMTMQSDHVTDQIRAASDTWKDIFLLNDDEVVKNILSAEIDILVDLSGHTAFNRLPVFAQRPAPIQATWIGYFHSTGLDSIDYFITDPFTTPRHGGQSFSEAAVYLPNTRFCYSPPDIVPDIETPSASYVTFGSFNRLAKINDTVMSAWSRILLAVPDSRLVLKAAALEDEQVCQQITARFAAHGVSSDRLELRPRSNHTAMLAEYGDIDLALDTFPFNGGMTTMEALWMGVPVLAVEGNTVVSRQTYSLLANIGLTNELVCPTVDAYVDRAIALANDRNYLTALRTDLRSRMAASPLRQAEQFTRDLEALYRRMWSAWCSDTKLPSEA